MAAESAQLNQALIGGDQFYQDAPVVAPDMLHTIWCAVNWITRKGVQIGPEECVSVYDEAKKGTIEQEKFANFVILDQNPLEVDKMKIKDIQVMETIKEGESVFKG